METAEPVVVDTGHHAAADQPHEAAHNSEFYATSNPKYFGLPLGVLIAATISAIAVGITLFKFFGASL
jgi:hypothetical protein